MIIIHAADAWVNCFPLLVYIRVGPFFPTSHHYPRLVDSICRGVFLDESCRTRQGCLPVFSARSDTGGYVCPIPPPGHSRTFLLKTSPQHIALCSYASVYRELENGHRNRNRVLECQIRPPLNLFLEWCLPPFSRDDMVIC